MLPLRPDFWGVRGYQGDLVVKNLPANAEDMGSIPNLGRFSWRRKWQPTPAFLPGNPMDRRVWQATVHGVAKESDTTEQQQQTLK